MTHPRPLVPSPCRTLGLLAVVAALLLPACSNSTSPGAPVDVTFDFAAGPQEWTAGFADYRAGEEAFMELDSGYRAIPAPVGPGRSAHFLSGNNHTDDLFMFVKRRLTGFRPDTSYRASFRVEIATDVPADCGGVGGSPGQSVYLKAGAATIEPIAVADGSGMLRLNVDQGSQANPGAAALVLGTIGGTPPCGSGPRVWELKSLDSGFATVAVTADGQGDLWVFTGTDSAFEGTTSIYITRVSVRFDPM